MFMPQDSSCGMVFKRFEYKYLLDEDQYRMIISYIRPHTIPDVHGLTTICNIYYDTSDNDLIRMSIDKPLYKEKLRLRSYGVPDADSMVFMEIKKKYDKIVYKRRISLTLQQAEDYLIDGVVPPVRQEHMQRFNEIDYFVHFHGIRPAMFVAYDRAAFFDRSDRNMRITFDSNIRSRTTNLTLGSLEGCEPYDFGYKYVMELKGCDSFPLWLVRMLSDLHIYKGTFTKYGRLYKREIERKI